MDSEEQRFATDWLAGRPVVSVDADLEVVGPRLGDVAARRRHPAPVLVVQEHRHRPVELDRVADTGAHLTA